MRPRGPMTDAKFEYELQWAIDNGATTDCGLPEDIIDLFANIHEADEAGREPLIATVREKWETLKKDFPEDFTD